MIEVNVTHDVDEGVGEIQKEEDSEKREKAGKKNLVSKLHIEIIYQVIVCRYSYFSTLIH